MRDANQRVAGPDGIEDFRRSWKEGDDAH
jgi:hypothetical protein